MTLDRRFPDHIIEKANALIEETWRDRFASIRSTNELESGIVNQLMDVSNFCSTADTRSLVVVSTSFLEDCIKLIFSEYWKIYSKYDRDAYFGSNGPLNSLDQRLLIAKSIKWISDRTYKEITILRKIRNQFAHNHKVKSFSDDPPCSLATTLTEYEARFCDLALKKAELSLSDLQRETRLRMRVFITCMLAIAEVLSRSKLNLHGIPPEWRGGKELEWHLDTDLRISETCIRHCASTLHVSID